MIVGKGPSASEVAPAGRRTVAAMVIPSRMVT